MKVRVSGQADRDIRDIYKYSYRQFGASQADRYYSALWQCFRFLAENPHVGHERMELRPPVRSHHHRKHVIYYDIFDGHILIVRVLHERMDVERHMQEGD